MSLLAQGYFFADFLIIMLVVLGLVAICIPRPRKKFQVVDKRKKLIRRNRKPS